MMAALIMAACSADDGGGAAGSVCAAKTDCADHVCHKGLCASPAPADNGQPCASAASCLSYLCVGGVCVAGKDPGGGPCLNGQECASGRCVNGKCDAAKGPTDAGRPDRSSGGKDAGVLDQAPLPDKTLLADAPPWKDMPWGTECKTAKDCDDKIGCTTDACDKGFCKHTPGKACVTTAAGTTGGYQDGPVSVAQLKKPLGVAVDGKGVVYIADSNNRVRVLSAAKVSTLAPAVTFGEVADVAVNSAGTTVYVADRGSSQIKIISGGKVKVLAGSGTAGLKNGLASSAEFKKPRGVAVDGKGVVYVADTDNHLIRMIKGGMVTTLAGSGKFGCTDGAPGQARFYKPNGVAVDSSGNIYVGDTSNYLVRKVAAGNATVSTIGGHCGSLPSSGKVDGPANKARFWHTYDVDVNPTGTKVYVVDRYNHLVRMISGGVVSTIAGGGGWGPNGGGFAEGALGAARFKNPQGVAFAGASGVYVADWDNHRLRLVKP